MSLTEEELEKIKAGIAQQNKEIQGSKLAEELDELSKCYHIEAESILKDLNGDVEQRSLGLRDDLKALSKDVGKIHEDLAEGRAEDFQRDAHELDKVIMDLNRMVLYTLSAYNLAKKSNTIARYNANGENQQHISKARIKSNKSVMRELRNQMEQFHKGVKGLSNQLEEVNYESNKQLNQELGELSKLMHYIEYFAETGTPDPEIRGKLEEIEEEYDRRASSNLKKARENARNKINGLIKSQSRGR